MVRNVLPADPLPPEHSLRLIGGNSTDRGMLQLLHRGQWGVIDQYGCVTLAHHYYGRGLMGHFATRGTSHATKGPAGTVSVLVACWDMDRVIATSLGAAHAYLDQHGPVKPAKPS